MDAEDILLRGTGVGGSLNLSASFFPDMLNSPDLGCSSIEATSFRAPEEHRPAKRYGNLPDHLATYYPIFTEPMLHCILCQEGKLN